MKTVTITPEGYACKTDNIPIETFSIDFIEPDVSAASTSFRIQLGKYGFEHEFEFGYTLEKIRHSIEQLCFRHTKSWIDFPFDDTVTRLDCEVFSESNSGFGKDVILITIIPNGYVRKYNRIDIDSENLSYDEMECSPRLEPHTAYVDATTFINELYAKIMGIADDDCKSALQDLFRQKFKSPIIEAYLANGKLVQRNDIILPR